LDQPAPTEHRPTTRRRPAGRHASATLKESPAGGRAIARPRKRAKSRARRRRASGEKTESEKSADDLKAIRKYPSDEPRAARKYPSDEPRARGFRNLKNRPGENPRPSDGKKSSEKKRGKEIERGRAPTEKNQLCRLAAVRG